MACEYTHKSTFRNQPTKLEKCVLLVGGLCVIPIFNHHYYKPGLLNQKYVECCFLSRKNASRLAVLREIGRYPLLLSALSNVFKYEHSLRSRQAENTVISSIFREIENCVRVGQECWQTRVKKIHDGIGIKVSGSHRNKMYPIC